ncbi:MAG: FHA domain-containing protein [Myxococcaceae bacterium]|nr:FHA domain-containing protein [Myxococcaceae bacterium]
MKLTRGVTVKQVAAPRQPKSTAMVMKDLLAGNCDVENTQASTLTVLTGADSGNVIPLAFEQLLVGRGDDCDFQIRDPGVSRRHARLVMRDDKTIIEDLRGHNGTYVNGVRIRRRATLVPGDVVEMGKTLLRYDAPETEAAKTPSPPSVVIDRSLTTTEPYVPKPPLGQRWVAMTFAGGAVALIFGVAVALTTWF